MTDLKLTLACGDYEITRALTSGAVKAEGIEFVSDTRFGARDRHWAMAKESAYDVCEFNAPAYVMARDRGFAWTAIPSYTHRRFRHGFVFVNPKSGFVKPSDLKGARIGGTNFQPAGNIWIRGILEEEWGLPHRSVHWFTERGEDIDFTPAPDLRLTRIEKGQNLNEMLMNGDLDALMQPEFPDPFLAGDPRIVRLFPDYKTAEQDYFKRTGIFPIMHVTVVKRDIVDAHPWVPASLMKAFEAAKSIAYRRVANPRVVPLAWFSWALEEQNALLGRDPWAYGLGEANRRNLETMIRYTHQQGLISRIWSVYELFCAP